MRVLPILFNTEMVRAILEGRKTVTRRLIKPQPERDGHFWKIGYTRWSENISSFNPMPGHSMWNKMPYHPGDTMYVRETWCLRYDGEKYFYRADKNTSREEKRLIDYDHVSWKPSIHMPKEAARIFLRVKSVRVERLQKIEADDALREGIVPKNIRPEGCKCSCRFDGCMDEPCANRDAYIDLCHTMPYAKLWDSTIKKSDLEKYGWIVNPWVWVIEFERCDKPENE